MEAIIIFIISWHNNNNNNNNNNNSNNDDDLKEQNDRLKKKETLIRKRSWSCLYTFEEYRHYTENNLREREKERKNGVYNTYHGPLSQEWIDGDTGPRSHNPCQLI